MLSFPPSKKKLRKSESQGTHSSSMEIFTRFLRNGTKKADVTGLEAKVYLGTIRDGTLNEVLWCPPKLKAPQKVFPHLKPSLEEF